MSTSMSRLRTLDLGLAPNLEELVLVKCKDLKKLHLPRRCINLRCLLLTYTKLRTLDIGLSPNLKKFDLQNSYCLEELHMNECQKLTKLKISHSMLRTLDLGLTPNIKTLDLKECDKLIEICTPIGWRKQLVHVDLSGCLRFKSFLFQIKNNTSCSVDESIVVGPIPQLNLFVESLERCRLHPDNNLPNFRFDCVCKEDRPSFTRNLEMLFSVGMCDCTNLQKFSGSICGLQRLRSLDLRGSFLEAIKDFDRLECLEELILVSTTMDHLPDSICMLKHLKHLELSCCRLLEKLPDDLGRLECLEELDLAFTKIKHLSGSICMLKSLKSLDLYSCSSLGKLPKDLGQLRCLEELILVGCESLQYIPNSICEMKCLKCFDITNCIQIENLPEEFGHLESLEALGILLCILMIQLDPSITHSMAFYSTTSLYNSFKYDVFLSFRGEDTRTNFIDNFIMLFIRKAFIPTRMTRESEKAKVSVMSSSDPLKTQSFTSLFSPKIMPLRHGAWMSFVKIIECQRTNGHTAYPVFYDVEPSEIRKQSGVVGKAFCKHENEEAVGKWREALKVAADLAGWELKNVADSCRSKFIQNIVEERSLELHSISFNNDEKLVGMESRINDVLSSLETKTVDVRMMGIKGIGGGGKTTLARGVFDRISFQFEGKSFLENVREVSNASLSGLKSLQNQVLADVLNDNDIKVSNVYDGKQMIQRMMHNRKVLVVLDDVDHIGHLEVLAGELTWFKVGSRILITTRDEQVLFIHHVSLLSDKEAIHLFNRYAFGRNILNQEYEELSIQVVRYAAGLPLTIRVLGSFLCGKNELEWIDAIERLKTIPLKETLKKLELSYIDLEEDYKEIFLDVACIMKGWRKDDAIKAIECCGFHARNSLKVLEQKSLITIYNNYDTYDYYEYVDMHDHIEEMGRSIVRFSHPDKPHKHTRLWIYEEIENVLANDLGTKATWCIRLDTQEHNRKFDLKGLRKMKELRFLSVGAARNQSLPITFQANNLVALEMVGSKIVLKNLRILDLRGSMLSTLDLRITPNIETLKVGSCVNLVELHMHVECLKLISVNLEGSWLIKTINLRLAPNIKELILNFCNDLETLLMPERCLNLIYLQLTNSKVRSLDIGQTPDLWKLDLEDCHYLEQLNMEYECQKLSNLNISHSKLRTVNLGLTPNLEKLKLKDCDDLVELHTPVEFLKLIYINLEGSSVRILDLRLAPNIEELNLNFFIDLEKLQMPNRCLNLRNLQLTN
ncbi:hypothetical protein LXL04_007148 [Taraxacum kok-saghyz]